MGFWKFFSFRTSASDEDGSKQPVKKFKAIPHGKTGDDFLSTIPFQVLSWKPRTVYFPNFATAEQCESIVNSARPLVTRSKVASRSGDTAGNISNARTSYGVFMNSSKHEVLDYIERKIANVTMIPRDHGEDFNVLRYEIGQKFNAHYDASVTYPRVASFLLYLTDVEEGGETMFPNENGTNTGGFKVKPRRGDGLLFYSLFPNGILDKTSFHASCPVIKGEKWVATKWLRNTTFQATAIRPT